MKTVGKSKSMVAIIFATDSDNLNQVGQNKSVAVRFIV